MFKALFLSLILSQGVAMNNIHNIDDDMPPKPGDPKPPRPPPEAYV